MKKFAWNIYIYIYNTLYFPSFSTNCHAPKYDYNVVRSSNWDFKQTDIFIILIEFYRILIEYVTSESFAH